MCDVVKNASKEANVKGKSNERSRWHRWGEYTIVVVVLVAAIMVTVSLLGAPAHHNTFSNISASIGS